MSSPLIEKDRRLIHIVTGGAGFIGFTLVKRLLSSGARVAVIDNNLTNRVEILKCELHHENLEIFQEDISLPVSAELLAKKFKNDRVVIWHLAANSDIRSSAFHPEMDIDHTFKSTLGLHALLRSIDSAGVFFASSSAVYGPLVNEVPSDELTLCTPISYYGAMKLASEHFLQVASSRLDFPLTIFRFANIVGIPSTHGLIHDLVAKLQTNQEELKVLGDGSQSKTYLHVEELIDLMLEAFNFQITGTYNLGPGDSGVRVSEIAEALRDQYSRNFGISYDSHPEGWPGDVVISRMNVEKMLATFNTKPEGSKAAIERAISEILNQSKNMASSQEFLW